MDQGFRAGGLAVPSDFPSAAMQRFGIPDIRILYDSDMRFLEQLAG